VADGLGFEPDQIAALVLGPIRAVVDGHVVAVEMLRREESEEFHGWLQVRS
jgi:hypothetical protein